MYPSLIKTIGVISSAGGVWGVILMFSLFFNPTISGLAGMVLVPLALVFFIFGIWSGIQTLRQKGNWFWLTLWFWVAQIPMFVSPVISYVLSCGAAVWLYLGKSGPGFDAGTTAFIGSGFNWTYGMGKPLMHIGVNLLAIAVVVVLFVSHRQNKKNEA